MRTKLLAAGLVLAVVASAPAQEGLTRGTPAIKSITSMTFGPDGLLFVGDPQSATIFAIATGDNKPAGTQPVNIERVDAKIAAAVGASDKEVRITDVKVNPASGNVYISIARGSGAGEAALIRIKRGDNAIEAVSLKDVMFAQVKIPNPAMGKGAATSITSMAFVDGQLIVAGLSNEAFASTLRIIPYPFKEADKGAGIEIFHGAHNKIETAAPIRTFVAYKIANEQNIMAAYTCTPLVKIPVSELKAGAQVKGKTIAELGNGNQPLDMIVYSKDGKDYLLIANTNRGVMKVPAAEFANAPAITTKPTVPGGVKYESIPELKGVIQLDKVDAERGLILVKAETGFDLKTIPLP